ncbi:MAG: RcnB family protein [Caulobacteraceae bacterium]|nr:RcnB family protein [Caulobacteraceae bacterium]
MKKLLLTASALASLAMPAASFAQDQRDNRQEKAHDRAAAIQDRQGDRNNGDRNDNRNDNRRDNRQEQAHDRARAIDNRQDARGRWDRNNHDWWRGRADFRGFNGRRAGFWFRPGFGYVRIDPRYAGFRWRVGGRVPVAYRRFYVSDPFFYGLSPAPYGYRYVYLDNNIVLMSLATGLITQVVSDIY